MIAIEFVIINTEYIPRITGKPLDRDQARKIAMFAANVNLSDEAIATMSRIVKKLTKIRDEETLLKRVIEMTPSSAPIPSEIIERDLLEIEKHIDSGNIQAVYENPLFKNISLN